MKWKVRLLEEREISQAVIRRLPRYYRYLGELLENGVERISSNDLSKRMKVTASQIRQDLNNFGGFGQSTLLIPAVDPISHQSQSMVWIRLQNL